MKVHPNGEPTFASLGLGGSSPIGIAQSTFEWLHITLNMPWWATIVLATVVIRALVFPLVIIAQKNTIQLINHGPEMVKIQMKLTEARQKGNEYEGTNEIFLCISIDGNKL